MTETPQQKREVPKTSLLVLGALLLIIALSAVIPAKWFGIEPYQATRPKLDLTSLDTVATDVDGDNAISWRELFGSTLPAAELETEEKPDPTVIAQLNDPYNLTASFSKSLYTTSAQLATSPINNEQVEQTIISQLVAQETEKIEATTYSVKDLAVAKTETQESVRIYGNAVAAVLQGTISETSINRDLQSVIEFIETENPEKLQPLINQANDVQTRLQKLIHISTPPSATPYHLLAVNRLASYGDMITNISQAQKDPIRAAAYIDNYVATTVKTLKLYGELSTYFKIKKTPFSPKDTGYIFITGYTN